MNITTTTQAQVVEEFRKAKTHSGVFISFMHKITGLMSYHIYNVIHVHKHTHIHVHTYTIFVMG